MNLNPKQPSGTATANPTHESTSASASTGRRSSWLSKLSNKKSGRPDKATSSLSTSETASITSHTPLVTVPADETASLQSAATPHERSSYVAMMEQTKDMTPDQVKEFLAKADKEHEEKYVEKANVGRWQWKFMDKDTKGKPRYGD